LNYEKLRNINEGPPYQGLFEARRGKEFFQVFFRY